MHERLLSEAARPTPQVVLGMLLRPYSLGHELWLTKLGNPLAESSECTPRELAEAVLICSQSWRENERMAFDFWIGLKLKIWKHRVGRMNLVEETKKFVAYRNNGSMEFPISVVEEPSRGTSPRIPGCPFLLRLQQWLMLTLRLSEAEAWDYPYGMAKCRWACHWEQEGGLKIYNAHDAEFDRFVEEQERKGEEQCQA